MRASEIEGRDEKGCKWTSTDVNKSLTVDWLEKSSLVNVDQEKCSVVVNRGVFCWEKVYGSGCVSMVNEVMVAFYHRGCLLFQEWVSDR